MFSTGAKSYKYMENLKNLNGGEIRTKLENKKKALAELSMSLNKTTDELFLKSLIDSITAMQKDIDSLEQDLVIITKPIQKSLNQSFDL
jgi:cell fate (sporulation/competence/biofilm development) regulator YmcA (YheA/YmcA/DUF963 family)